MDGLTDSDVARKFDAFFRNAGGYLDTKLLPPEFPLVHSWAERANMFCAQKTQELNQLQQPIIFGFVNNLALQACAGGYMNMLAVYLGVPLALLETFGRLLALPTVLPRIGNRNLVVEPLPVGLLPKRGYLQGDCMKESSVSVLLFPTVFRGRRCSSQPVGV